MPQIDDIAVILRHLTSSNDRLTSARKVVLEHGGSWPDDPPPSGIFEMQLLGLVGIGPSANTAVEDWIAQAETVLAKPLT